MFVGCLTTATLPCDHTNASAAATTVGLCAVCPRGRSTMILRLTLKHQIRHSIGFQAPNPHPARSLDQHAH